MEGGKQASYTKAVCSLKARVQHQAELWGTGSRLSLLLLIREQFAAASLNERRGLGEVVWERFASFSISQSTTGVFLG